MSKCFGVFLLCFAWLGFLFCCLGRAVGSVVRYLGAISAEVDVKFFLIYFFKPVVSLPGSVWPHRWLCWQEAEGTAGQGRALGQPLLTWLLPAWHCWDCTCTGTQYLTHWSRGEGVSLPCHSLMICNVFINFFPLLKHWGLEQHNFNK